MKLEQTIQRLNSILERNSDRKVNQLIPEDIRQLNIAIYELKQTEVNTCVTADVGKCDYFRHNDSIRRFGICGKCKGKELH